MLWKRIITIVIILAVIAGAGYYIYNRQQQKKAQELAELERIPIERGDLVAIIGATGTVRANQTSSLAWQTSGRIGDIYVGLDDMVSEDQLLAELVGDSLSQTIILAQADLITNLRALEDLTNSNLKRSQAYQELVAAESELEDALEDRENLNFQRTSQNTIDGYRADYQLAENKVKDAEESYDSVAHLQEDDDARILALSNLSAARRERDKTLANLNWALSHADAHEISEADARIEVASARLEDAKRDWDRLQEGPDPDDIAVTETRIAANEATIKLAIIKAPFSGTITAVNSKIGDQVSTGTTAFRIDDLSRLLLDIEVPEVDVNRITVGQPAILTFDAILGKEYHGQVTEVARVGMTNQGVVNFTITVKLLDPDENVLPGMTAAVNIVVTQLEGVLLVPNRAVRLHDGSQVVYMLVEEEQTPVDIQIGASSETHSEIIGGDIKEGDLIILNPVLWEMGSGPPGGSRQPH